ncbi:hypothetical protein KKG46_03305 [Patescibacteria group bacterium]|nr:hypothetical protein [Patescibacteria group bacterium]
MKLDDQVILMSELAGEPVTGPTIQSVIKFGSSGAMRNLQFYLRWFGANATFDLGERQFLFPLALDEDSPIWIVQPNDFNVVYVGLAKNWPIEEAAPSVIEQVCLGDENSFVIWMVSSKLVAQQPSGSGPVSLAFKMHIMLGDGVVGIIKPREFCDMNVLRQAEEHCSLDSNALLVCQSP